MLKRIDHNIHANLKTRSLVCLIQIKKINDTRNLNTISDMGLQSVNLLTFYSAIVHSAVVMDGIRIRTYAALGYQDWKKTYQANSCPRDWRLPASWGLD